MVGEMGTSSHWAKTPRQSVAEVCARRGVTAVVAGCVDLLNGRPVDDDLILALGGPPADWVRTGEPSGPAYWLRVWAARGLLYAWDDSAEPAVLQALRDDEWRVREMALKVVARHRLKAASQHVVELRSDPAARVRAAATRTTRALTGP
jgi:HEAT repeat protein